MKSIDETPAFDRVVDVVIVGMGVAGVCAALEAHRAGAEVLMVERASGGGGTSATSEGIFYLGGGTAVQKACGYEDSAEEMFKFLRASTSGVDEETLRAFADGAAAHFDWLEAQGVPFARTAFKHKAVSLKTGDCLITTGNEKAWPFCEQARPAPRGHQVAQVNENSGAVAMRALLARCEAEAVPALYDAQVTALITGPDGRVLGVRLRRPEGEMSVGARKGVILATGSFNANPEMVRENVPLMSDAANPIGTPYNDGSGIRLGQSAGGALQGMDGIIATASIYPPEQLIKGVVVNKEGHRFVAEDVYHGRLASFIMEQPDQAAYLIVDAELFAYPETAATARHVLVDGWDTVAEMEAGLHIPQGSLVSTLAEYNRDVATGEDRRFHKQKEWLKPLDTGPFAAFDISFSRSIYSYLTLGGLRTNASGQALGEDGEPIPGLYAVGACAAQMTRSGKEYASGLTLGPGSFFGRIAGRHAAAAEVDAA